MMTQKLFKNLINLYEYDRKLDEHVYTLCVKSCLGLKICN